MQRTLHRTACLGLGAAAAILGLLPWLVRGGRLPLQLLWEQSTLPGDMPFVLLPFSQYAIFFLLGLLGTGFVAAGIAVRSAGARVTRAGSWATWGGVAVVHVVAVAQTTVVVAQGQESGAAGALYLAAILVVVVVAVGLGTLGYWLIARAPVPGAVIGLTIGAICFGNWLGGFASPLVSLPDEFATWIAQNVLRWVPAVGVGAAIAWGGLTTWGRRAAALVALLILWIQLPLTTAISSATSRVLLRYPAEMLDQGAGVLRMVSVMWDVTLPPLLVAFVAAGLGLAARWFIRRRTSTLDDPA